MHVLIFIPSPPFLWCAYSSDEFQEIKAVKALRRGRRLQVVEAVYGKQSCDDLRRPLTGPHPSCIPRLRSEFFSSPFFQAFITQRAFIVLLFFLITPLVETVPVGPIIDLHEISLRFLEAHNGNTDALGVTGQLLCMVLAAWAASFGVNEMGEPESPHGHQVPRLAKERTNLMTQELLQLVDIHGVLRKPTCKLLPYCPRIYTNSYFLNPYRGWCARTFITSTFDRR